MLGYPKKQGDRMLELPARERATPGLKRGFCATVHRDRPGAAERDLPLCYPRLAFAQADLGPGQFATVRSGSRFHAESWPGQPDLVGSLAPETRPVRLPSSPLRSAPALSAPVVAPRFRAG